MPLPNYIKFLRGTSTAYNNLNVKDLNTLYFILDPGEEHGKLYLGERLIGSDLNNGVGASSIAELSDVLINEAHAGDFLVLNSAGKWINQSASEVAAIILNSEGFISDIDENEFNLNAVSGKLELLNFDSATAGMMPVKSSSGTLVWLAPPPDLSSRVGSLETDVGSLTSDLLAILQTISGLNHLSYEIINNLNDATDINVIYLYPKTNSATGDIYDEYMLINNNLEKIGSTSIDLSNYVTSTLLQTTVGNLENELNNYVLTTTFLSVVGDLSDLNTYNNLAADASITDIFEDIYERLIWQEISEE